MKYPKKFGIMLFLVWCFAMIPALMLILLIEIANTCHNAGGKWIYTACVKKEAVIW